MSSAKKGLGRSFESLIPTDLIDDTLSPKSDIEKTLPLAKLSANPDQPRRNFEPEALQELADSLKEYGMIQPIVVTPKGDKYEIVAGERRFRASKLAGLKDVPVIIRTTDAQNQLEIALVENIQRRDLNAIETAVAYAKLRDQFNLSNDQISQRVHKSGSSVVNTLRLLKLPKIAIEAIASGKLTEGQARPLIGQDEALIKKIIPRIIAESWSARKVEQYVVNLKTSAKEGSDTRSSSVVTSHEASIKVLKDRLNTRVDIRTNAKGAGKIVIGFKDQNDLDRIQKLLGA